MAEIIGVRFKDVGKIYSFDPVGIALKAGDFVIVETARGVECGMVATGNHEVDDSELVNPLKPVLRKATEQDLEIVDKNCEKEKEAYKICLQKINKHKLEMASVFRTRIELRQIGVRDEAKMIGGLGICGRPFCCSTFLGEFQPVSIKMAKEQGLSLNPVKISGTCGRLMCCLKHEQNAYDHLLKITPKQGALVQTPNGKGTVVDVNLLTGKLKVQLDDHPDAAPSAYSRRDVKILRDKAIKVDRKEMKELSDLEQ